MMYFHVNRKITFLIRGWNAKDTTGKRSLQIHPSLKTLHNRHLTHPENLMQMYRLSYLNLESNVTIGNKTIEPFMICFSVFARYFT